MRGALESVSTEGESKFGVQYFEEGTPLPQSTKPRERSTAKRPPFRKLTHTAVCSGQDNADDKTKMTFAVIILNVSIVAKVS